MTAKMTDWFGTTQASEDAQHAAQVLQDSLCGSSKVLLVANLAPEAASTAETLSSLSFAARAAKVPADPHCSSTHLHWGWAALACRRKFLSPLARRHHALFVGMLVHWGHNVLNPYKRICQLPACRCSRLFALRISHLRTVSSPRTLYPRLMLLHHDQTYLGLSKPILAAR